MSSAFRPLLALLALTGLGLAASASEILPVPPQAMHRAASVQVRVSPDHLDWTYQPGEKVSFKVFVTADNEPLTVPVTYTVGPELMPAETHTATTGLQALVIDGGTMKEPGFLRLTVEANVNGRSYKGAATAAFSPERIQATQVNPDDFDAFWDTAKKELAGVPMDARMTLLPEACTAKVNVYQVSFRTIGVSWAGESRIYGIYCEPKAPGRHPALLRVPGAGVRPYNGDKDLAERGFITLEIGIHGIPVNLPKEVYDNLQAGALRDYWSFNFDNREQYYFRRVIMGCLRANDFLTSRDCWDGKNLLVAGASQGGFLSLATGALDPRVTGLSVTHPALCDLTGPLHGRAGGWPHPFRDWSGKGETPFHATPAKIATSAYYDGVNFARRLRAPGFYIWGYNDDTCPPTSTFSAYNSVTAPKELTVTLEQAHTYPPEQYDVIVAWLLKAVK
jgi:cephalosporin-C deacetylase-like acetyl esterase